MHGEEEDLWMRPPEGRFGFEGEEAVWERERATAWARGLANMADGADLFDYSTTQLLWDAAERAEEALRRARQRIEGKENSN
jgi:hypothetical protein